MKETKQMTGLIEMTGLINQHTSELVRSQTLVEKLVATGIIVAIAAVIVPLIIQFSGSSA